MITRWAAATIGLVVVPPGSRGESRTIVDSKGNLYTAEVETARRAQKFVNQGGGR
jgi:hypothetical protein